MLHIDITITTEIVKEFYDKRNSDIDSMSICTECPVARVLQIALNNPEIRVNGIIVGLDKNYNHTFLLPEDITRFIRLIDSSSNTEELQLPKYFSFEAEIIPR